MSDRIRQMLAFVIAMGMVIAVASAPTVAQVADPGSDRVFEIAGLNADTVDGRHAVKATTKTAKRAGKIVATNSKGYLPSNIIRPRWKELKGVPTGFKDGVDNVGAVFTTYVDPATYSVGAVPISVRVTELQNVVTDVRLRPSGLNNEIIVTEETYKRGPSYDLLHYFRVERHPASPSAVVDFTVQIQAISLGSGPAAMTPAALKKAVRESIEVKVVKGR